MRMEMHPPVIPFGRGQFFVSSVNQMKCVSVCFCGSLLSLCCWLWLPSPLWWWWLPLWWFSMCHRRWLWLLPFVVLVDLVLIRRWWWLPLSSLGGGAAACQREVGREDNATQKKGISMCMSQLRFSSGGKTEHTMARQR